MTRILLMAAVGIALTGSSQAKQAKPQGHLWFHVNYSQAKCEGGGSPQAFYELLSTPAAHLSGMSADRIAPEDVIKDATGNIHVHVTGTNNGESVSADFFTSMGESAKPLSIRMASSHKRLRPTKLIEGIKMGTGRGLGSEQLQSIRKFKRLQMLVPALDMVGVRGSIPLAPTIS
ncbi:MAG: hypothetical protein WA397_13145 [Roseiarcus sp.]